MLVVEAEHAGHALGPAEALVQRDRGRLLGHKVQRIALVAFRGLHVVGEVRVPQRHVERQGLGQCGRQRDVQARAGGLAGVDRECPTCCGRATGSQVLCLHVVVLALIRGHLVLQHVAEQRPAVADLEVDDVLGAVVARRCRRIEAAAAKALGGGCIERVLGRIAPQHVQSGRRGAELRLIVVECRRCAWGRKARRQLGADVLCLLLERAQAAGQ